MGILYPLRYECAQSSAVFKSKHALGGNMKYMSMPYDFRLYYTILLPVFLAN
jgi:hypothetical protein